MFTWTVVEWAIPSASAATDSAKGYELERHAYTLITLQIPHSLEINVTSAIEGLRADC